MIFKPNDQQQAFIEGEVNLASRVLAGPGSGKTFALVRRVDHLIRMGINPDKLVVVSHTRQAADEVASRAQELNPNVNLSRFCTIHALAFRALKAKNILSPNPTVAVGEKAWFVKKFANEALEFMGLQIVGWKDFMAYINSAKQAAIRPENLASFYYDVLEKYGWTFEDTAAVSWASVAHRKLAEAHIDFDKRMKAEDVITFNDMHYLYELALMDSPAFLAQQQASQEFVMIDEAQDTNRQAMNILNMLAKIHGRMTVIGDADQSIFQFIGARPEDNLWHGFERNYPEHATFMLETNYRSTPEIVAFTNKAIEPNYDEATEQYRKTLVAYSEKEGKEITFATHMNSFAEAQAVATGIKERLVEGDFVGEYEDLAPGDFFVLARTRAQLPYTLTELFRAGIPAATKGGFTFWDLAHIQNLLGYMRLAVDPKNREAFARVYNVASDEMMQGYDKKDKATGQILIKKGEPIGHRYLGKAFLEEAGTLSGMWGVTSHKTAWMWKAGMEDLEDFMDHITGIKTPGAMAEFIIDHCLRPHYALTEGDAEGSGDAGRVDDLLTIADIAGQVDDDGKLVYPTVQSFLDFVDDMIAQTRESASGDMGKVVLLSTIHGVKGLERDVVYVLGVMEEILPHWTAVNPSMSFGDSVLPTGRPNTIAEERRLFFVAISRAAKELHLTGPLVYRDKVLTKSRFVLETGLAEDVWEEAMIEIEGEG